MIPSKFGCGGRPERSRRLLPGGQEAAMLGAWIGGSPEANVTLLGRRRSDQHRRCLDQTSSGRPAVVPVSAWPPLGIRRRQRGNRARSLGGSPTPPAWIWCDRRTCQCRKSVRSRRLGFWVRRQGRMRPTENYGRIVTNRVLEGELDPALHAVSHIVDVNRAAQLARNKLADHARAIPPPSWNPDRRTTDLLPSDRGWRLRASMG